MTARRALVVDDSRSARAFLTRILERYELAVDGVESAEQAIEYLTHQRPDVIFMDHLMPGMDGFQAVQAIKNNPRTATIPIMMYTSQEGELYLSQARALGAIGVLPKQIKHADVSKALDQLRLLGEQPVEREILATPPLESTAEASELASEQSAALEDTADIAAASMQQPTAQDAHQEPPRDRAPRSAGERRGRRTCRRCRRNFAPSSNRWCCITFATCSASWPIMSTSQAERVVADVRLLLKDQPPPIAPVSHFGPPEPAPAAASGSGWPG